MTSIPNWWYWWTGADLILSGILAILTAITRRDTPPFFQQQPAPAAQPPQVWDPYAGGYPQTMLAPVAAPTTGASVVAHPAAVFGIWLFGSFAGYVLLGLFIGTALQVLALIKAFFG